MELKRGRVSIAAHREVCARIERKEREPDHHLQENKCWEGIGIKAVKEVDK